MDGANWQGSTGILVRLLEHLSVTALATACAAVIVVPLGLWAGHHRPGYGANRRRSNLFMSTVAATRALPALGLLTILALWLGVSTLPSLIVLIIIAAAPLLAGVLEGLAAVPEDLVDAARAQGLTEWQILTRLEIPLAANMMLGYAYMSAPEATGLRDFNKAKDALLIVVNGPFKLVNYADLFDYTKPNTKEAIFEWQFDPQTNPNQLQFQLGSRAAQNSFGGDGCYFAGYDHAVPTEWAYSDVADGGIWENGDKRKEESIRYDYTYMGVEASLSGCLWENIGSDHDELKPHIKKYEDYRTDQFSNFGINNMWNSGKNIPYLRYANAILLYAECLNEIGQTPAAVKEVNRVRSRAWNFNLPADKAWSEGMSKEQFRTDIMTERVRELFGERWRRFDLARTGKLVEAAKAHNKWTKRSGTIQAFNAIWPIPQTEINQNEDISQDDQNEGYK